MNIAILGLMGTGKTTVSRLLAKNLDKKLIATDDEILKKTRISIPKFIKKYGHERLREAESELIEHICGFDECIFDTGTSVAMRNENLINLKKGSLVIMLTADIKTITNRIKNDKLMSDSAKNACIDEIKNILQGYESRCKNISDYIIDTSRLSPEEVCDLIIHYARMELK